MFNFLRKTVVGRRNLLERDSTNTILCFLENPFFIRSISTNSTNQNSFTVSYLVNSCGLSQEKAVSVSKKVSFEDSTKPDSVLALLKNNGFPDTYISKIIQKDPSLLLSKVDKTLKPKFDFFNSKGLSGPDLSKVISVDPFVLSVGLDKTMIPSFEFLKSIVHADSKVVAMLKRSTRVLKDDPQKRLAPNIAFLQAHGVPDSNISKLLVSQPAAFLKNTTRFNEIVNEVKKMEFDPAQFTFLIAIHGLTSMSTSTLEAKFEVYRMWGLSEDEIQCIFRKKPYCMMISEKNIMCTMNYLVNKMGYDPSFIAKQPGVLLLSLEKRIVPRCSVIQVLISNDLINKCRSLDSLLQMNEKDFLRKFVTKFEEKIPELLNAYQGKGRWMV